MGPLVDQRGGDGLHRPRGEAVQGHPSPAGGGHSVAVVEGDCDNGEPGDGYVMVADWIAEGGAAAGNRNVLELLHWAAVTCTRIFCDPCGALVLRCVMF